MGNYREIGKRSKISTSCLFLREEIGRAIDTARLEKRSKLIAGKEFVESPDIFVLTRLMR